MRAMLKKKTHYLYFIQLENTGPIKIGLAKNPNRRLIQLQTANPYKLNLLYFFPSCKTDEDGLHYLLRAYRLEGEWFLPSKKVLAEIEAQKRIDEKIENWSPLIANQDIDLVYRGG